FSNIRVHPPPFNSSSHLLLRSILIRNDTLQELSIHYVPTALFFGFVWVSAGRSTVELVRAKRAVHSIPVKGVRNNKDESWINLTKGALSGQVKLSQDQHNGSANNGREVNGLWHGYQRSKF
ncbi:MAG TPA: hypothetical protein PKD24_16590, partial [Pyrinomonadaceae bacterium]|nr:hypothetical protein [Pyrinomonadaceae bacterium]HMP67020.1 hypothetical protein [Pyrinomonadaceae bacterium]